jgi:hypothetical protein
MVRPSKKFVKRKKDKLLSLGHNMTLSGLGGLLLVFGLIAQNSAELGHISIQGIPNSYLLHTYKEMIQHYNNIFINPLIR